MTAALPLQSLDLEAEEAPVPLASVQLAPVPVRPQPYLRKAPSCDPPYDDERPEHEWTWPPRLAARWEQLSLLLRSEMEQVVLEPSSLPPLQLLDPVPEASGDCFDGPQEREPQAEGLADIQPIAHRYVRAFLEVLSGQRQPRQLLRVATPEVLDELENRGADLDVVWAPTLRTVRVSETVPGVAEICAVVATSGRLRALSMRVCGYDGSWVITHASVVG